MRNWARMEPEWTHKDVPVEPQPGPELSADERQAWERAENQR